MTLPLGRRIEETAVCILPGAVAMLLSEVPPALTKSLEECLTRVTPGHRQPRQPPLHRFLRQNYRLCI